MLLRTPPVEAPAEAPAVRRRPLRDNPRVLGVVVLLLVALLVVLFVAAGRTSHLDPGLFSEAVLYVLYAVDLTMVAALLFVLARNVIKVWNERRRALPFARFRAKLVAALLALTLVPAVLVLLVGTEFIRSSAEKWFSAPVGEALDAAQTIASRYYVEHRDETVARADRLARAFADRVRDNDEAGLKAAMSADIAALHGGLLEIYRDVVNPAGQPDATLLLSVGAPMPRDINQASADRLAERVAASGKADEIEDPLKDGVLIRAASPIHDAAGRLIGVIVASEHVSGDIMDRARLATTAYQQYKQLEVWKDPLQGVYLAFFLMMTLLILVSATWLGLYVAKRITRPVQALAEGARAIGAGQFDVHLEPETSDELASLIDAFNTMAAELRTSQQKLDLSRRALERTNVEVEARRRYIETILDRVATGVVSLTTDGRLSTLNGAAARLLALDAAVAGQPAAAIFGRADLQPLLPIVQAAIRQDAGGSRVEEIKIARDERELSLAVASTALIGDDGRAEGAVVVFDDVTPLIRSQRVAAWKDVARRLAHEIKNPLTPIQLSAERLQRHFGGAPPPTRALVDECTAAIVTEVEALKGLVDEFAQFARMPAPRTAPVDVNRLVADALHLNDLVLQHGRVHLVQELALGLPLARVDAEQMRRVVMNLVDNALEALGGPMAPARPSGEPPTVVVATAHDAANGIVRLTVTDNGPGVPPADRDKLFMPYYSTKGRGSGLGLAIVRRIVVEHGGTIEVVDMQPGTRFIVELPVA